MTKKELAGLSYRANQMNEQLKFVTENLVVTIEKTFGTLATIHPEGALQVIQQLQEQVSDIEDFIEECESEDEDNIASLAENVPDVLEFEE